MQLIFDTYTDLHRWEFLKSLGDKCQYWSQFFTCLKFSTMYVMNSLINMYLQLVLIVHLKLVFFNIVVVCNHFDCVCVHTRFLCLFYLFVFLA